MITLHNRNYQIFRNYLVYCFSTCMLFLTSKSPMDFWYWKNLFGVLLQGKLFYFNPNTQQLIKIFGLKVEICHVWKSQFRNIVWKQLILNAKIYTFELRSNSSWKKVPEKLIVIQSFRTGVKVDLVHSSDAILRHNGFLMRNLKQHNLECHIA